MLFARFFRPGIVSRGLANNLSRVATAAILLLAVPALASVVDLGGGYTFNGSYSESGSTVTFNGSLLGPGTPSSGYSVNGTTIINGPNSFHSSGTYSYSGGSGSFSCDIDTATGTFTGSNCGVLANAFFGQTAAAGQARASSAVNTQVNRTATQQTVSMIGRRISSSLAPKFQRSPAAGGTAMNHDGSGVTSGVSNGIAGISAGDSEMTKGVWATYSHGWVSTDWEAMKSRGALNTGASCKIEHSDVS
ncbi:hypothetical protein WCLP8_430004 [uncultured Gammaproteobacteria bacterium]